MSNKKPNPEGVRTITKKDFKPKTRYRYFLMPTTGDDASNKKICSRIIVFTNGTDGQAYFDTGTAPNPWWELREMETMKCVEIPATLIKRLPR